MADKLDLFGLSRDEQDALFSRIRRPQSTATASRSLISDEIPRVQERYTSFKEFPELKKLKIEKEIAARAGIMNPFFKCHDGIAHGTTQIEGVEFLNFSTYDYLGFNGDPILSEVAFEAAQKWGTSASASRLVSGERPPHRELEKALADIYCAEDCIAYVSGHATNVSTISKLFGPNDIIFHDALAHNSIVFGAVTSGARRISYPHNDCEALEKLLKEHRFKAQRALIVTEGLFSMDGNIVDLPKLISLKKKYGAFLMVDEAHALGVLGAGRGTAEHFGIDPREVDLWMGTLSKTCCGCGGYIAGSKEVVELLKFTSPGFVYSVGMSPVLAAVSKKILDLMIAQPQRVNKLQEISHFFLESVKAKGFDTGRAQGYAIVPVMLGSSLLAGTLAARLFERRVNVMPIIHPVVEEGSARLRFFLSEAHTKEHIEQTVRILCEEFPKAKAIVQEKLR